MLRPEGMLGPLHLVGRGRDLVTDDSGNGRVCDTASLHAVVGFVEGRTLREIASDPADGRLAALVGARVSSGFRSLVDDAAPEHRDGATLLHQLLDDLPVATLVSGYAFGAAGMRFPAPPTRQRVPSDVCAGWRSGGTIMLEIESSGSAPVVTGPVAPSLTSADDPTAWHELEPLPVHGMRRARRIDVVAGPDGTLTVDSLFRDSYRCVDGVETVIHEYTVTATVDARTLRVVTAEATPHALPWVECPVAAASGARVVGRRVDELRDVVRTELVGTTTCTHLNDQLRCLADVATLAQPLDTTDRRTGRR